MGALVRLGYQMTAFPLYASGLNSASHKVCMEELVKHWRCLQAFNLYQALFATNRSAGVVGCWGIDDFIHELSREPNTEAIRYQAPWPRLYFSSLASM